MFLSHHLIIIILLNYNYNMHPRGKDTVGIPEAVWERAGI